MLIKLRVRNFKCFEEMEIALVTIFLSNGVSSRLKCCSVTL